MNGLKKVLISKPDRQYISIQIQDNNLFKVFCVVQCCHLAASLCTSYLCLVGVSAGCPLHLCLWVYHTLQLHGNLFWTFSQDLRSISLHGTCKKRNFRIGYGTQCLTNIYNIYIMYNKQSKHTKTCNYILLILFSYLYSPKAPFAVRMLALILQGFRDSSSTVPQPLAILPALLLHHTTANALPKGNVLMKQLIEIVRDILGANYRQWQPPYLSEPLKAADRLAGSRSIFKTLPQPLFIPHSDVVTGIHVTPIFESENWVKKI